nr:formin-binding protein 4-like [Lytechinus pictus]XP_054761676.1 formin-binding protein 4-like [Lytechinus pictus]
MGKKKDRSMPGPGKRRTVLQIDGPAVSTKKGYAPSSSTNVNALSGLMANYGDSDEEQDYTPPTYSDPKPAEAPAKPKTAMDAKLADFLAEIDAMDTASNSPAGETEDGKPMEDESIDGRPISGSEPDPTDPQALSAGATETEAGVPNPELTAVGEWQELLDENTNCVYYWNMYTNEVTWEMPQAFKLQQEQLASATTALPTAPDTGAAEDNQDNLPAASVVESNAMDVQNGDIDGAEIPNGVPTEDLLAKMADAVGEVTKDDIEKLPVYGSARVKYQLDPVPDELKKDDLKAKNNVEEEEEEVTPIPRRRKINYESKFTKGETLLPATVDAKSSKSDDRVEERIERVKEEIDHEEEEDEDDDEEDDGRYDLHPEPETEIKEEEKEKDELYAVDMFADEMDDIDTQLEMALEKKKAELKELEEAEDKKSPEPSKSEKSKKRKTDAAEMASIYDESGSVDLSRFKKKRLENLAGKQKSSGGTQETGIQCDLQDEITPEERDKAKEKQKKREEKEKKEEIVEMVSTMMNKLEFLGISTKGLNKFQVMLIEMETRIQDWREGLLESKQLLQRLETSDWELQRYETDAAPKGWLCSWDRTHKQYYYTNISTNESQWDYPVEAAAEDAKGAESTVTREETRSAFSNAADRGSANDDGNSGEESMDEGNTSDEEPPIPKPAEIQLPPALPPSPTPPQPPMPQEEAESPLPPPPLPDGPPPPPPPGEEPALPPLPPSPPPSTPPPAPPPEEGDTIRPLTPPPFLSSFPGVATMAQPPPPPQTSSRDSSTAVIGKPQVLYSAPAVTKGASTIAAAPVLSAPATQAPAPPVPQQPAAPPARTKKKKKKGKEGKLVKSKLPHSLVSKWSKIKEEQEKEMEESEESEEEDIGIRNQKMIQEWKKEQLVMGKAKYNANFEQIQGDWRERLKRKAKP